MKHTLIWITAIVTTTLASVGIAGEKPDFKEADQNGDGKVSVKEASKAGAPKKEAKRADLDDNGKLTKSDWEYVDWSSGKKEQSGQS